MADLLTNDDNPRKGLALNIFCVDHGTVHKVNLFDLERLVYVGPAAEADAYMRGHEHGDNGSDFEGPGPVCPLVLLQMATSPEGYLDHVTACMKSRVAS